MRFMESTVSIVLVTTDNIMDDVTSCFNNVLCIMELEVADMPSPPPPCWKYKKSWLPKDLEMVVLIACSYLSVLYAAQFTPLANFEKMWPAPGKGTIEHNSNNRQNVKNFSLSENLMYYYLYHVKCRYGRNWILCIKKRFFSRKKRFFQPECIRMVVTLLVINIFSCIIVLSTDRAIYLC